MRKWLEEIGDRARARDAFTLVELLVTVAIVSALAAIAIPLFIGDRNNASASKAEQTIQQAIVYTEDYYQRYGNYEGFEAWAPKHAPEIAWKDPKTGVETSSPSGSELKLYAEGSNGNFYCVKLVGAGLSYGTGKTQGECETSTLGTPPGTPNSSFPN